MELRTSSFAVDITPIVPCNIAGYGSLSDSATSVFSRLEANVLVFYTEKPFMLVQLDTLYASAELRKVIEERIGLEVILFASHSHGAPFLDSKKTKLGVFNVEYLSWVAAQIADGFNKRAAALKSEISYGEVTANLGVYRRKKAFGLFRGVPYLGKKVALLPNPRVKIDQRVSCFEVRSQDGQVLAVLWRFTCHPVTTPDRDAVTADFPGFVRSKIRTMYGKLNLPVLFMLGPSGDVRPNFTNVDGRAIITHRLRFPFEKYFFTYPSQMQFKMFNESLAKAVETALKSAQHLPISDVKSIFQDIPFPSLKDLKGKEVNIRTCILSGLGDIKILFVGAEVSSQYQYLLNNWIDKNILLCGYFDDVFGYLPTEEQSIEGGYEGKDFIPLFDLQGHFPRGFEKYILGCFKDLVKRVN